MSEKDNFEIAARTKLRFPSAGGDLNIEQVYDLDLNSDRPNKLTLNILAKESAARLRGLSEDSFVSSSPNKEKQQEELRMEMIKHIIAVKISERDTAANRSKLLDQQRIILEALAKRETEDLASMSTDQLREQAASLQAQLGS